jgi:hypothetical protein
MFLLSALHFHQPIPPIFSLEQKREQSSRAIATSGREQRLASTPVLHILDMPRPSWLWISTQLVDLST